jgi:hypothetical protein
MVHGISLCTDAEDRDKTFRVTALKNFSASAEHCGSHSKSAQRHEGIFSRSLRCNEQVFNVPSAIIMYFRLRPIR